jgi:phage major head subunit gpT-like protein
MGVISTGSFAKALFPGIKVWYGDRYKEFETEYNQIFDKVDSNKAYEEYVGFSGMGLLQKKPEGTPISYDDMQQGFVTRATNVSYALGFIITHEMYADDQYSIIGKRRANALAFSARQTKEIVGANVLNRAFTAGYTFGDGQVLLSSGHLNKAGGTWSNTIAVAADLSEAALEQAAIDVSGFLDDRGNKISVMPRKLIIPKELMFEATRILKSIQQAGSANNDINALRVMNVFPDGVVVNHYLTDTDAWFVKTNIPSGEGLIYQEREADSFSVSDDSDTLNAKYRCYGRYSFTCADVRSIYGSSGA